MGHEMLHELPATTGLRRAPHSPPSRGEPAAASGARAGSVPQRERERDRERQLWNDTITPAEQAAREPSGMSCLSKALSAPLRAPTSGHHTACRDPRCCGDGDGLILEPTKQWHNVQARSQPTLVCVHPPGQAGVPGGSCPADSQQLVWCEQRFSDHLLAVGGAGSTPPGHIPALPAGWGTRSTHPPPAEGHVPTPAPGLWVRTGCRAAQGALNGFLRSWQRPHNGPCCQDLPLSRPPRAYKPRRNRFGPCGQSGPPGPAGRAGREGQGGRSPAPRGHVLPTTAGGLALPGYRSPPSWHGARCVPGHCHHPQVGAGFACSPGRSSSPRCLPADETG